MTRPFEEESTSDFLSQHSFELFSEMLNERVEAVDALFREVRQLHNDVVSTSQLAGMDAGLSSAIQILRGVDPDQVRAMLCLETTAQMEREAKAKKGGDVQ